MNKIFLLIISFICTGCMQLKMLPYLDQALLLQSFGKEKDAQHKLVDSTNTKFEQMWVDVNSGEFKKHKLEKDVIRAYGPPILAWEETVDGKLVKRCLYRRAIGVTAPHKIYVDYDPQGRIAGVSPL